MTDLTDLARRHVPKPPAGLVLARAGAAGEIEVASAGPVAEDAVFELGSITKAVTGLLLADAVTRGEVALETELGECLPGARARARIALADLASHTAGLPRLPLRLLRRKGVRNMVDPYGDTTVEELIEHLAGVRVKRRRRPRYSNFGAALLGQALAARAGKPYEQLVHERVLEPLQIAELWAHHAPLVAQPHDRRGRAVPAWNLGAYAPAGCLRGSVRGALALSRACLRPPHAMAAAVELALTPRARRGPMEFGLGWIRSPVARETRMWWHNGGTNGSRSFTGFVPERRQAVAAATNSPKAPDRAASKAVAVADAPGVADNPTRE